jgi:hypothetical protein
VRSGRLRLYFAGDGLLGWLRHRTEVSLERIRGRTPEVDSTSSDILEVSEEKILLRQRDRGNLVTFVRTAAVPTQP